MAHSHGNRPKRRSDPYISDIVREVAQDIIQNRKVRCTKCKDFKFAFETVVCSCAVCLYIAGRCEDCGGEEGAVRSIVAHNRVFSSMSRRDEYGDDHWNARSRIKVAKTSASKLRMVRGGKR